MRRPPFLGVLRVMLARVLDDIRADAQEPLCRRCWRASGCEALLYYGAGDQVCADCGAPVSEREVVWVAP